MGMIGALHPVEADRQIHIAASIRVRACDARVEQHHGQRGGRHLSSQTSSMRQPLKMLLTMVVHPLT